MSMGTFATANVYCDMTTDNGGWIVIQRNRINSQLSFNKNWREYEEGFGDLNKDFWAGLELMHTLTQRGQWEMRLDYQKNDKSWSYLHYNQFSVGSASEEYPLTVGGFTGIGIDLFIPTTTTEILNQMKFTTADNDNDKINMVVTVESDIRMDGGIMHVHTLILTINHLTIITLILDSLQK